MSLLLSDTEIGRLQRLAMRRAVLPACGTRPRAYATGSPSMPDGAPRSTSGCGGPLDRGVGDGDNTPTDSPDRATLTNDPGPPESGTAATDARAGSNDLDVGSWVLVSDDGYQRRVRFSLHPKNGDQPGVMLVASLDGSDRFQSLDYYALSTTKRDVVACIGFVWLPVLFQHADGVWFGRDEHSGAAFVMMRPRQYADALSEAAQRGVESVDVPIEEAIPSAALWISWNLTYGATTIDWD